MSVDVTAITTAEQLQDAASAGAQDMEIRAHLDLRGLEWHVRPPSRVNIRNAGQGVVELLFARGDLRSLRVRACTTSVRPVAALLHNTSNRSFAT